MIKKNLRKIKMHMFNLSPETTFVNLKYFNNKF